MSEKINHEWINIYIEKCENKYQISELGFKIFQLLKIDSQDERLKPLSGIILQHFLDLEARKE